jgi:hypothetical protein
MGNGHEEQYLLDYFFSIQFREMIYETALNLVQNSWEVVGLSNDE